MAPATIANRKKFLAFMDWLLIGSSCIREVENALIL
jgi:hypothetical protein